MEAARLHAILNHARMSPQEIDEILQRYLKNEATPAEQAMVDEWFDAIGKEETKLDPVTRQALQKKLWSSLLVDKPAPRRPYMPWIGMAASILLLAVASFYLYRYVVVSEPGGPTAGETTADLVVKTDDAEKSVTLSDGSVVTLKQHSEIRFPAVFGKQREVSLSGEAFFEIARDVHRPFLVHANEVTTRVLGTSFLIKAYAREPEVTVAVRTGKVSIYTTPPTGSAAGKPEIILTPNQQIVYHRSEQQTEKMLVSEPLIVAQQPTPKVSYHNVPVATIFHEMEERYGIPIQFDEQVLVNCTLIYVDFTDQGLYDQLETICDALGARYKKTESSIVIESEGCN
jgi:transmembrane sensor